MYEILFFKALGLTVALETVVLAFLAARIFRRPGPKPGWPKIIAAGVFASAATLPFIWFILPAFIQTWWLVVLVGEITIVLAEAVFYYFFLGLKPNQALAASLICNLASFLLGLVVRL